MATFRPTAFYRDPKAALDWLAKAFGFETSLLLTDADGKVGHAEMTFGDGTVGVGGEWTGPQLGGAAMKSPASLAGVGTQFIWVELSEGLDVHHDRAAAAGARIAQAPETQFYGARTYRALDLEGHVWCFSQTVDAVSTDEMEIRSGLKVTVGG
jgi:uncharacterized glyoxalase superfamily protein PhnB